MIAVYDQPYDWHIHSGFWADMQRYPVARGLLNIPIRNSYDRKIIRTFCYEFDRIKMGLGDDIGIAVWSYEEFLTELAKPKGGRLQGIRNIGAVTINTLRRICIEQEFAEYEKGLWQHMERRQQVESMHIYSPKYGYA